MSAPDVQGEGAQQLSVLPDGQHAVVQQLVVQQLVVQQLAVQQLVVQQLVVQQALGVDTGQQVGCAAALLEATPVGTGQHVMASARRAGQRMRGERAAPAAAPGAAATHAAAVAANRSESKTRKRRIAVLDTPGWTGTA